MNKEFISYEEALALKELGFDEKCFGLWIVKEGKEPKVYNDRKLNSETVRPDSCSSPLWQQAFRWFREKYGVLCDIDFGIGWGYGFIPIGTELILPRDFKEGFANYEEAQLACLQQLIKIVKDGKDKNTGDS